MSYLVLKLKKKLKFRINLDLLTPEKIVNKKVSRSSVGFRCDQKGKVDILRDLNIILSQKKYTNENVEHIKNSRELCIDQEIILRYFNNIKKKQICKI